MLLLSFLSGIIALQEYNKYDTDTPFQYSKIHDAEVSQTSSSDVIATTIFYWASLINQLFFK
jgi:hypothetical protein